MSVSSRLVIGLVGEESKKQKQIPQLIIFRHPCLGTAMHIEACKSKRSNCFGTESVHIGIERYKTYSSSCAFMFLNINV